MSRLLKIETCHPPLNLLLHIGSVFQLSFAYGVMKSLVRE